MYLVGPLNQTDAPKRPFAFMLKVLKAVEAQEDHSRRPHIKTVLTWGLRGAALLVAPVIALFVGTLGDYVVAALVTEDATLPSREVSGVALHVQIVVARPTRRPSSSPMAAAMPPEISR